MNLNIKDFDFFFLKQLCCDPLRDLAIRCKHYINSYVITLVIKLLDALELCSVDAFLRPNHINCIDFHICQHGLIVA